MSDLSDCELFVPGISYDKVSDITTNVIRRKLVEFTQEQCVKWNVPMQMKPIGVYWDPEAGDWNSGYDRLPVRNDKPIILVPKRSIRYRMAIHDQDYYRKYVLEHYRNEFLRTSFGAMRSLEKTLKKPLKISKKEIAEEHPKSKEFLQEFTIEHPELLAAYKKEVRRNVADGKYKLTDAEIVELMFSVARGRQMIFLGNPNFYLQAGNNSTFGDKHVKNVNVGGHLSVGGDFVVADAIRNSFNKVAGSSAPDPVKDTLKQLADAIAEFSAGLPGKQAQGIAEEYDRMAEEAIKPEPKKNWLKTGLEGIRDAATIAGVGLAGYTKVVDLIEQARQVFGL